MRARRFLSALAAPGRRLWRNVRAGGAPPPAELLEHGPRLRASARYGGMGERELQLRMERIVDRILSSRHSLLEPARELAACNHFEQRRFLAAGETLAAANAELAYRFFHFGLPSLRLLEEKDWDGWLQRLLDRYDRRGVTAATAAMQRAGDYARELRGDPRGVRLEQVAELLEAILAGFGGRPLKVAAGAEPHTDTDTVFLPERMQDGADRAENFALLKAAAARLWAQARHGTYRADLAALGAYPDRGRARRLFLALETLRLDARIGRELPGVGRVLARRNPPAAWAALSAEWAAAAAALAAPGATAADALRLVGTLYPQRAAWPEDPLRGALRPELAAAAVDARAAAERRALARALAGLRRDLSPLQAGRADAEPFAVRADPDRVGDEFAFDLRLGEAAVAPTPEVRRLLESIVQDFGAVPDEYLQPAGAGAYDADAEAGESAAAAAAGTDGDALLYPEWDHSRQRHRPDWCRLRERPIAGGSESFALDTLVRRRRLLRSLRATFEALRDEERRVRREPHGDELDLDAAVAAYGDFVRGAELDARLFSRRRRQERDVAAMFLVDMSGSTRGWVNELVRESLVLLCGALETLGDRYAIYGFSGRTHRNCELYPIKRLDEAYGAEVRRRIGGIAPQDYTRMGVMIRHLTQLLKGAEARTRLLIALSDGKPDDQDGYRGAYGIEDTRQALHEARHLGIHPYCITIDDEAMAYLPHMYGAANFAVVDRIERLPRRVSDIYRRLTA